MRVLPFVALTLAALAAGCSATAELSIGFASDAGSDGGTDPYPDGLWGDGGTSEVGTDAYVTTSCPAPDAGKANLCVSVNLGALGPSINDESRALGIKGQGVLYVGLSTSPYGRGVTFAAAAKLPSATSGGTFSISELPRTVTLPAAPGVYYLYVAFHDQLPFDRDHLAPGDYTNTLLEPLSFELHAGDSISQSVSLFPVRGINIEMNLAAKPVGNGVGPARAWLRSGGQIVGDGKLGCVDFNLARSASLTVLTTSSESVFDLFGGFYDFATGLDDAAIFSGFSPPPGTITSFDPATRIGNVVSLDAGRWLTTTPPSVPPTSISLSHVVPGSTPTEPPGVCMAGAPAVK